MIGVLGRGAWGSALVAVIGAREPVAIWSRGASFEALAGADVVLSVVPAQATREVLCAAAPYLTPRATLVMCAKGVERDTHRLMTDIAAEAAPGHPLAVLSGPGFAADVVAGLPTAVTLAAETMAAATALQHRLASPAFRPYPSDDLIGAQIGGALKNVLAIACGIVVARGLGESARAALIARGFAEMTRLAVALGGRAETVAGLSGLGDLVLTCGSAQSRNFAQGIAIGRAGRYDPSGATVEGAKSAAAAAALASRAGVDAPITGAVAEIIDGRSDVDEAIDRLLSRPLKGEE